MTFRLFGIYISISTARSRAKALRLRGTSATHRTRGASSDTFFDAFSSGGALVAQCGACGRTHFVDNACADYDPGELECLEKDAAASPDKFIADTQHDSIAVATVNGLPFPWNCPCRMDAKYEQFVWDDRKKIMRYLSSRIDTDLSAAQYEYAKSQVVKAKVDNACHGH